MYFLRVMAALAMLLHASPLLAGERSEVSFLDKEVKITLGVGAGGPTAVASQMLGRYLAKELPGHPTVVVDYLLGAGGLTAANRYLADTVITDGTQVVSLTTVVMAILKGDSAVRFDPSSLHFFGIPQIQVLGLSTKQNLRTLDDIVHLTRPINIGSSVVGGLASMQTKVLIGGLGRDIRYVHGYRGSNDTLLAVSRGELDLVFAGMNQYLANPTSAEVSWVCQTGFLGVDDSVHAGELVKLPLCSDLFLKSQPNATDISSHRALLMTLAIEAVGGIYALPPGTSQEIADVYSRAFLAACKNPAYQAEALRLGIPSECFATDVMSKLLQRARNMYREPAVQAFMDDLMKEETAAQ